MRYRGIVLVIVLVVIVVLALAAYTFTDLMVTHRRGTRWSGRQIQARLLAESGVAALQQFLALDEQQRKAEGGVFDNPHRFRGVVVMHHDDPSLCGGFSVVSAAVGQQEPLEGIRFGAADESARLNINALQAFAGDGQDTGREMLMGLPGMTVDIADAIMDWLDADDDPRQRGAETDYYASLVTPYRAKNGPLDSVEELLLVRGVTRDLLFGVDQNHNYVIDPHEMHRHGGDGSNQLGWSALLTIYSNEHTNQGKQKQKSVYVNQEDMQQLYDELLEVFGNNRVQALFVVAYRQNGPFQGQSLMDSTTRELDLSAPAKFPIRHVLDLVDQNVQVTLLGDSEPIVLASPFKADQVLESLPELDAALSVYETSSIPGRINVLAAPPDVLRTISCMDEEMLQQILAGRNSPAAQTDDAWLLTEGVITLDQLRDIAPYINNRGNTYRAQIIGYLHDGSACSRLEVVIDTSGSTPRLVMCRDLSQFGRGFSLETLGVEQSGAGILPAVR